MRGPYQLPVTRGLTQPVGQGAGVGADTPPRPVPALSFSQRPLHLLESAPQSSVWTWLAAFLVLLVAVAAWSFASPLGSGPDEPAHLDRAASLVRGQLLGTPLPHPTNFQKSTVTVRLPEVFASLANDIGCFQFKSEIPAGCAKPLIASAHDVQTQTYVGRYPPLYYALVGLPTLGLVSAKGIYAARLLSGALSAAFLALAVTSLRRCRGAPLLAAGVGLAITPMALYLAAVINPNGLEVAAAISAWAAAMALVSRPPGDVTASTVGALGISLVVLLLARPLSPLWVVAIVTALAIRGRSAPWHHLFRRLCARVWLVACSAAAVGALAWDLWADPFLTEPGTPVPAHTSEPGVFMMALERLDLVLNSSIGFFGWLDSPSPEGVIVAWLAVLGAVVLAGASLGRGRDLVVVAGTLGAWVVLPVAVAMAQARTEGILGQGRDYLGLAAGIPIVAGAVAGERFAGRAGSLRLVSIAVTVLAVCQVADFYAAMRRNTVGIGGPLNAFAHVPGGWGPPVPGVALLAAFALAMAGFALLLRRAAAAGSSTGIIDEAIMS